MSDPRTFVRNTFCPQFQRDPGEGGVDVCLRQRPRLLGHLGVGPPAGCGEYTAASVRTTELSPPYIRCPLAGSAQ